MTRTTDEHRPLLHQLPLPCCPDDGDELARLLAAMERRHRERGSNPDTIKHLRQAFAAAREVGIRTRADLEDEAVDRRYAEGIAGLRRPDGKPRWSEATQDLMRRHFRRSIRQAGSLGLLRHPPDLERLTSPGSREWRESHPRTARTRRPAEYRVRRLDAHLRANDDTWSGLRIRALVILQEEAGIPLAGALRLIPGDVDLAFFYRRIRYISRRGGRERYAPISRRLGRVLRRWLDHCSEHHLFPNHTRLAPWDEVSARAALRSQCRAAGIEPPITFEQLQLCDGRPDREGDRPPDGPHPEAGRDIDFDALSEALLRKNLRLPSRLVRLMKGRTSASFEEVMEGVCGGEREESSIRALVNRTNTALHDLEPRLSFTTPDCRVLRHIKPASSPPGGSHATAVQRAGEPVQRPCNTRN